MLLYTEPTSSGYNSDCVGSTVALPTQFTPTHRVSCVKRKSILTNIVEVLSIGLLSVLLVIGAIIKQ